MGKEAHEKYAASREIFEEASEAAGFNIPRVCFGDLTSRLDDTRIAQPAIATVDLAEYAAWREIQQRDADVVTGLSMGLYPAMGVAGVFESFGQTVDVVAKRAQIMHEISKSNPGKMAAIIGVAKDELELILEDVNAQIGVLRDRANIIITGGHKEVDEAKTKAQANGARRMEDLKISSAAHSKLQEGVVEPFGKHLTSLNLNDPNIYLLSNTAQYLETADQAIEHALRQLVEAADWGSTIDRLALDGIKKVVEFGPDIKRGLARQMVKNYGIRSIDFPAHD